MNNMKIQCNSCEKTFVVSNGAITAKMEDWYNVVHVGTSGNSFLLIEKLQKENPISN